MSRYRELDGLYVVGKTIGSGGFAKVKEGIHTLTGNKVAIKIMEKAKLGEDVVRVEREIKAMKALQHQHICQLYQAIESQEMFYLILEHCPNGELFDLIISKERLEEEQARLFFCQIVSALGYMHQSGFAHRDLKPENLLLDDKQNLKLIDFGLCSQPLGGMETHIKTCCGSPAYAAPELLSGKMYLGREADIWSLGVLLYTLLCGCLPFDHKNTHILFKKIRSGIYSFPRWLGEECRALISRMLQLDPCRRIRMDELVRHPWVTKTSGHPVQYHSTLKANVIDHECIQVLRSYFNKSSEELKKYVRKDDDSYIKATYLLLLAMKNNGQPLRFKIYQDVKPIKSYNSNEANEKFTAIEIVIESNKNNEEDKENVFKVPIVTRKIEQQKDKEVIHKHRFDHENSNKKQIFQQNNIEENSKIRNAYQNSPNLSTFKGSTEQNRIPQLFKENAKKKHHYYETPTKPIYSKMLNPGSEPPRLVKLPPAGLRVRRNLCQLEEFQISPTPEKYVKSLFESEDRKQMEINDYDNVNSLASPLQSNDLPKNTNYDKTKRFFKSIEINMNKNMINDEKSDHNGNMKFIKVDNPNYVAKKHLDKQYEQTVYTNNIEMNKEFTKSIDTDKNTVTQKTNPKTSDVRYCVKIEEDDDVFTSSEEAISSSIPSVSGKENRYSSEIQTFEDIDKYDEDQKVIEKIEIKAMTSNEVSENDDAASNEDNLERKKKKNDDEEVEIKRISCQSPGKKLTRWKNNQRRQRPINSETSGGKTCFSDNADKYQPKAFSEGVDETVKIDPIDEFIRKAKLKNCRILNDWANNINENTTTKTSEEKMSDEEILMKNVKKKTPNSEFIKNSHKGRLRNRDEFLRSPIKIEKKQRLMEDYDNAVFETNVKIDAESFENILRTPSQNKSSKEKYGSNPLNLNDNHGAFENMRKSMDHLEDTKPNVTATKSYETNVGNVNINGTKAKAAYSLSVEGDLDAVNDNSFERNTNRFSKKIGKGVDRLVDMLTPSRHRSASREPKKIRSTHNVYTSDLTDAEDIMNKLKVALTEKNILYKETGTMSLRCTVLDRCNQIVVSFYLEVVNVKKGLLGVLRKRIQGDAWYYKRLCEGVFKAANLRSF